MPKTITHDTGGTRAGTLACLDAIRKVIDSRGECTETEARGIAISLYPPQVLVRIGAQKLKNRKRGTTCRFADDVEAYMAGGAVGPDAVQWFKIVGGNRQLTRIKAHVRAGLEDDLTYDEAAKRFKSPVGCRAPYVRESETSAAAAASLTPEALGSLQRRVLEFIRDRGEEGATDEECQRELGMNPSTQRPRRGELANAGLIVEAGTRLTSSRRRATVWRAAK
jgi:hypothetical protein